MTTRNEERRSIPWPPIILVGGIVAGSVLNAFIPLPFARGVAYDILQGAGVIAILCALALYFLGAREMTRRKTTFMPNREASHLVTTGPFSFSRNPIYLANVILLIGWGLVAANGWMFAVALLVGYAEKKLAIENEEAQLEHKFGKAWRDYRKRVRRWL